MSRQNSIAFANLRAEMSRLQIGIAEMASATGTNRDTLSRKLSRKTAIALDEAFVIKNTFFPDMELQYLFHELVEENKTA